jgi:hypothetical protein
MAETTLSISAGALTIPELVDERIDTQLTRLISTLSVLDLAAQNSGPQDVHAKRQAAGSTPARIAQQTPSGGVSRLAGLLILKLCSLMGGISPGVGELAMRSSSSHDPVQIRGGIFVACT